MKTEINKLYNLKSTNYGEATIVGIFLVAAPVLFSFFCYLEHVKYYGTEVFISIMGFGAVFVRMLSISWIYNIAGDLNRNRLVWSLFAFCLPGIALIIIGQKNELRHKLDYICFKPGPLSPSQALRLRAPFKWA